MRRRRSLPGGQTSYQLSRQARSTLRADTHALMFHARWLTRPRDEFFALSDGVFGTRASSNDHSTPGQFPRHAAAVAVPVAVKVRVVIPRLAWPLTTNQHLRQPGPRPTS